MKNFYEAPQVEVVEVMVEQGFATSNSLQNPSKGGDIDW
jgi:hypothetical protein